MEGFIQFRLRPWVRRLVTRALAIVPAAATIAVMGAEGTYRLLILSQVVLSMQLPFAVIPLIHFTSDRRKMGAFANALWVKVLAWMTAVVIVGLNVWLSYRTIGDWIQGAGTSRIWITVIIVPLALALGALLAYLMFGPIIREWRRREEREAPSFSSADLEPARYERIGVALEATDRDRRILAQAIPLAAQANATLMLIHVAEGMGPRFWKGESRDEEVRSDSAYLDQIREQLTALGLKVESHLGYGEPAEEIIRWAGESKLDLLVMGTHGHRFPKDILFGATATRVRHKLNVPVFMVRVE
jgi:manganese transport protein